MQTERHKIKSFAQSAQAFCDWVEKGPLTRANEVETAIRLLTDLYSKVIQLSKIEAGEGLDEETVSDDDAKKAYRRFKSLPFNHYAQVFNPLVLPPEIAVIADLADDLTDIYRDLKRGLYFYEDSKLQEAAWAWQLHFRIHWGRHLLSALYVLHCQAEKDWDAALTA